MKELAAFVDRAQLGDLSEEALEQLKIRVLDTIGVAIGALTAGPIVAIRALTTQLGGHPLATLIGGGKTAPDRAAFFNGTLSRYLDFMDSYIAPSETCHPSDNLGAVLAAAEIGDGSGRSFLTALAVAYQVQTPLSEAAPVRDRGFYHTVQGLLRKVTVAEEKSLTAQFPQQLPADLEVELQDGTQLRAERSDYRGFHTKPFNWQTARAKFDEVTATFTTAAERDALAEVIAALDWRPLGELTSLLATIRPRANARDIDHESRGEP